MNMSGLRYVDDPLVTVSGQFPLSRCDFSLTDRSEAPSGVATRPFALRWVGRGRRGDRGTASPAVQAGLDHDRHQGWERRPIEGLRLGSRPGR
jgi:hypothetical protein